MTLADLRKWAADDFLAATHQSMGQYRTALLRAIDETIAAPSLPAGDGLTDEQIVKLRRETDQGAHAPRASDLAFARAILAAPRQPGEVGAGVQSTRDEIEARQRAAMKLRFAQRPASPATADFDLPAPNDASAQQEEREAWQPIETAPKDGTRVLLMGSKGRIADGQWGQPDGWANPKSWIWPYVMAEPTHWMPLSAIQQVQADAGAGAVNKSAVQAFSEARSHALNVDWYTWQIAWKYARDEE